ncbi:hypothetical protein ABK040_003520 [Willaertia magna]
MNLTNLIKLHIVDSKTLEGTCFKYLKNLEILHFNFKTFDTKCLSELTKLKKLTLISLTLASTFDVECIKEMINLEYLDIRGKNNCKDEYFKNLTKLKSLLISGCYLNGKFIYYLISLEELDCDVLNIENDFYLKKVKRLILLNTFELTDNNYKQFTNLIKLNVGYNDDVNDQHLINLKKLNFLTITDFTTITGECFKYLTELIEIEASNTRAREEYLEYLVNIETLYLFNCPQIVNGKFLLKMNKLNHLVLGKEDKMIVYPSNFKIEKLKERIEYISKFQYKITSSLLTTLKRNNSTTSTATLLCGQSKLSFNFKPSLNTKSSLEELNSFSSIILNNNSKKYFHNNLYTNFFDFINTQQQSVMEYNEEQIKGMIEKLKYLEDKYKELEQQLRKEYSNFVQTGETMSPELFKMMIYIADYYNDFIGPKKGSSPKEGKQFFTSSIGLKIWDIVTKVKLLIVKSVIQEWFKINTFLETFPKIEYIPGELEDDRIYFSRIFDVCLTNSAFTPLIPMSTFIPYTREGLVSSIYFIIYRLRNAAIMSNDFANYVKEVVREYPIIKERYLNAKIIEDKYQMIYEQDKELTYLEKKYSEHEFDWFEDLETNLPLNLSSLIKLIEAYLYFPQDIDRYNKLLDESLKIDQYNFYTLLVASNYSKFVPPKDEQYLTKITLESKENCEIGLEILHKAKPLPLREEIKLEEGEVLPERENDLKLFPFYYEMAYSNLILAEAPGLAVDMRHSYSKKAIEEFLKVELFTRYPLDGSYYLIKGNAFYGLDMFEQAVRWYQYVDKYSSKLPKQSVIDAIVNSCNCLVAMGYAPMCLEELDKYIEQYEGDPRLRLEKIYVEDMMCKSKAELAIAKEKYVNLVAELSDPNFKTTDESRPYVQRCLDYAKGKIVELENAINDPKIAETW